MVCLRLNSANFIYILVACFWRNSVTSLLIYWGMVTWSGLWQSCCLCCSWWPSWTYGSKVTLYKCVLHILDLPYSTKPTFLYFLDFETFSKFNVFVSALLSIITNVCYLLSDVRTSQHTCHTPKLSRCLDSVLQAVNYREIGNVTCHVCDVPHPHTMFTEYSSYGGGTTAIGGRQHCLTTSLVQIGGYFVDNTIQPHPIQLYDMRTI